MGLREELIAIQIKPFQPIYSAQAIKDTFRIKNDDFLKKKSKFLSRPTTCGTETPGTYSMGRTFTPITSRTRTAATARTERTIPSARRLIANSARNATPAEFLMSKSSTTTRTSTSAYSSKTSTNLSSATTSQRSSTAKTSKASTSLSSSKPSFKSSSKSNSIIALSKNSSWLPREYDTKSKNSQPSRVPTASSSKSTFRPHTVKSLKTRCSSILSKTTNNENEAYDDINTEIASIASTNISLVTVGSNDMQNLDRTYGNFDYKSYFEQYMNGRAKIKIPKCNLPKNGANFDSEFILYDLLEKAETKKLLSIYNITVARPIKKRAKSVGQFHPKGCDEYSKLNSSNQLKKAISIEIFDEDYIDKKWNVSARIKKKEEKKRLNDMDLLERRKFLCDEYTDSLYATFNATDLKQPSLFEMGSKHLKKFINENDSAQTINETKKIGPRNPYDHIESRLTTYLTGFKKRNVKINDKTQSNLDRIFPKSSADLARKNGNANTLKLSLNLNKVMREDLRQNKGPVYFAELTEENLKSQDRELVLSDKYLNVFEWLLTIKSDECKHYYLNPFRRSIETNTHIINKNPETEKINNSIGEAIPIDRPLDERINVLESTKYKVDPFVNPKNERSVYSFRLPKRHLKSVFGEPSFVDIKDKNTLNVKKDLTTMLNLKYKNLKDEENYQATEKDIYGKNLSKSDYLTSRDRLKKKISTNDVLKTRMTLDLFIL